MSRGENMETWRNGNAPGCNPAAPNRFEVQILAAPPIGRLAEDGNARDC